MEWQATSQTPIQSHFLMISALTPIKEVINKMAELRSSHVIVVENQKLVGIFTERDIVRLTTNKTLDETLTLAEVMTKEVITLKVSETEDIFTLSRLLIQHQIRHLPVLDDQQQVVGLITPQSLRNCLTPEYLLRHVRVADVMTKNVIQGLPNDPIMSIVDQMASYRVSCVVIVDGHTINPMGIITERDVVRFHQMGLDFSEVSAQSVMSRPLSTMQPQNSLWSVHQQMQHLKVRRLVITYPTGELAGIVTQTQMLKILDPTEMYHVMQQMEDIIERQTHELQQLNQKLEVANQKLTHLSKVDELTQIMNRRQFNEFLTHEWQRLAYLNQPLSLILCDVDYFKAYNDTYGHLAGDECLVKIAQTLKKVTRHTSDLVARYGGEEFVIVLPNTDSSGANCVSQKIMTQIQKLQIPHVMSTPTGCVTVSLGTATVIPTQSRSPDLLFNVADQLLYQSKQQGRNTYRIKVLTTDDD